MDAVVNFVQLGARDPNVVSMKQTLYRTTSDSPMFHALTEAAQSKEVTVVVELMARFDEEPRTSAGRAIWKTLRACRSFTGICRAEDALQTRPAGSPRPRWGDPALRPIWAQATNPVTARFYTDLSLLTADPEITLGVHNVFNYLTAHSESDDYAPLLKWRRSRLPKPSCA